MKKAYDEVLCIRGRGAFKTGVCYPMMAGNVLVYNSLCIIYGFAANQTRTAEKGGYFEVLHGLEQSGARFVRVTRCKRRKSG